MITVIVFAIVTLFTFIRDSISLMDESILTVYNSINSQPLSENKSENEDEKKNENPKGSRGLPDGDTLCERLKSAQGGDR